MYKECQLSADLQRGKTYSVISLFNKRGARAFSRQFSWGTARPLIGQTAHGRMAEIIVLTVWPIRDRVVPHENWRKNALTSLFVFKSFLVQNKLF